MPLKEIRRILYRFFVEANAMRIAKHRLTARTISFFIESNFYYYPYKSCNTFFSGGGVEVPILFLCPFVDACGVGTDPRSIVLNSLIFVSNKAHIDTRLHLCYLTNGLMVPSKNIRSEVMANCANRKGRSFVSFQKVD